MEGGRGPVFRYRSAGGVRKRTRPAVQFEEVYPERVAQILNAPAVAAGPRQRSDAARNAKVQVCQFRLKIPHCAGRKFPTPELHEWASLGSDGVEPSAAFWRALGGTESEPKERAAASAPSCPRGGTRPALRRSFSR